MLTIGTNVTSPAMPQPFLKIVFHRVISSAVFCVLVAIGFNVCAEEPARSTAAAAGPSQFDVTHRPVERIEPGIVIGEQQKAGYSHLVTLVIPRLSAGYVSSLPDYAKRYASMFNFTVLANVKQEQVGDRSLHLLDKVRIGFAMDIKGKLVVVTQATANQFGAKLGMIDRSVLGGNEDCLEDVIHVASNDRMIMFDARANMLVGGTHQERFIRHLIWVSPSSGEVGFLVWQLNDDGSQRYAIDSPTMQLLPCGLREDRQIHVSDGGLLSSIPTPDRFALVSIPQGTPIPFSQSLRSVAGIKKMTAADLGRLVAGVSESLAQIANQQANDYR